MDFSTSICEILAPLGAAKPKKMFGTENVTLNGINLGVVCCQKWYLKKTEAGDQYLAEHGLHLDTGIKKNSRAGTGDGRRFAGT